MFSKQKELQAKLGVDLSMMTPSERQGYINEMMLGLMAEAFEALNETQWKNPALVQWGWKRKQPFNEQRFKEEMVDVFHFFMDLMIAGGMTVEELFVLYQAKHQINEKRAESGY